MFDGRENTRRSLCAGVALLLMAGAFPAQAEQQDDYVAQIEMAARHSP